MPARIMRYACWCSPSKQSTASTICSSIFGPAIEPSLFTCPTRITDTPSFLALPINAIADSRTCETLPGEEDEYGVYIVCIESIIITSGFTREASERMRSMLVSVSR